jgi:hypothetical protein
MVRRTIESVIADGRRQRKEAINGWSIRTSPLGLSDGLLEPALAASSVRNAG